MLNNHSLYGNYRQVKFTDVWGDVDTFLSDYLSSGIQSSISQDSAKTLYYLLYSRFGNDRIASSDTNRFKYDVWGTIFSYGPTWEKRLEIQKKLRDLTDDDLFTGATQIYNHAFHNGAPPATSYLDELPAINEQNTNKHKKAKMDAYAMLMSLLETDVTQQFLNKFQKLFLIIVQPEISLWYVTDTVDDDIIGDGIGDGN